MTDADGAVLAAYMIAMHMMQSYLLYLAWAEGCHSVRMEGWHGLNSLMFVEEAGLESCRVGLRTATPSSREEAFLATSPQDKP